MKRSRQHDMRGRTSTDTYTDLLYFASGDPRGHVQQCTPYSYIYASPRPHTKHTTACPGHARNPTTTQRAQNQIYTLGTPWNVAALLLVMLLFRVRHCHRLDGCCFRQFKSQKYRSVTGGSCAFEGNGCTCEVHTHVALHSPLQREISCPYSPSPRCSTPELLRVRIRT